MTRYAQLGDMSDQVCSSGGSEAAVTGGRYGLVLFMECGELL